jgi:RimJ/RimL family protein N-acetyltransferase
VLEIGLTSQVGDRGWGRIWIDDGPPEIRGHAALRAHSEQPTAHRALLSIGVLEPYRRAGIALRLMHAAVEWATRHGQLDWIDSEVFGHNERRWNLHRRVGCVEAMRVQDMFRLDGRSVDDVRLVLPLNRVG